jgi:hypothetical protein
MILDRLDPSASEFAAWHGLSRALKVLVKATCIPLPAAARRADGRVNVHAVADALGMPLVASEAHKLWALGPVSGGRALTTAVVPELTLPDRDGNPFRLGSLKGTKVFMCAWASW